MWILHLDRKFIALILTVLILSIVLLSFILEFLGISWRYMMPLCILLGLIMGIYINYRESKRISGRGDFLYGLRIYRYMPGRYLSEILILLLSAIVLCFIDPVLSILIFALLVLRILSMR
ncbi:MAG: hypothetical protein DRO62_00745 [Candidatus Altiarchaeales archaeon]|nr:MAG: hypothetical protein DRO62_00745 [Candidatus Altiarchaeales archaeon]